MSETHNWEKEDFSITTYEKEGATTVCLGGLAYHPSDFADVALELPGTIHVVNNPIHTGTKKRTADWQQWLRSGYVDICNTLKADFLVGHSCGGFDALAMKDAIPSLKGVAMITPPYESNGFGDMANRLRDYGLLDLCLTPLCTDLSDAQYENMVVTHHASYGRQMKDIYRHEMPSRDPKHREAILESMRTSRIPLFILLGSKDPWNKDTMGKDTPTHITVRTIDTNHYPHLSAPKEVAAHITQWMQQI